MNLPTTTNTLNTLCFSGHHPSMSGSRSGPSIDNIVINFLSGPNSTNQTN